MLTCKRTLNQEKIILGEQMQNFGEYIKHKRTARGFSLREFAKELKIAPSYLSDIEKGKRNAPSKDKLDEMISKLYITGAEIHKFYDLAKNGKPVEVAEDVLEYLSQNEEVAMLCRKIKDSGKPFDAIKDFLSD